jgi:hypothetical protein
LESLWTDVTTPHFAYPVDTAPRPEHVSLMYCMSLSRMAAWPTTTVAGVRTIHTLFPLFSSCPWKMVAEGWCGRIRSVITVWPWIRVAAKLCLDPIHMGRTTTFTEDPLSSWCKLGSSSKVSMAGLIVLSFRLDLVYHWEDLSQDLD